MERKLYPRNYTTRIFSVTKPRWRKFRNTSLQCLKKKQSLSEKWEDIRSGVMRSDLLNKQCKHMVQPPGHRMGVGDIVSQFYILNHIIRLQVVAEFITSETALALELISSQQKQTRPAVHLNGLVLQYLLAEEGGVCEKFNTSDFVYKLMIMEMQFWI